MSLAEQDTVIFMKSQDGEIEFAIEVFVRGHSAGRSRTFPYEVARIGPLWVMRDAPRKNPRDYRKEEWIAHRVDAGKVDSIARSHTRGRFFVCVMIAEGEPDAPTRSAYKNLALARADAWVAGCWCREEGTPSNEQ